MITLVVIPGFWKEAHEADQSKKGNRKICRRRRGGFAARCKSRSQDRPYPRNTHLYLEGRQGRSGETVKQQNSKGRLSFRRFGNSRKVEACGEGMMKASQSLILTF